MTTVTGSQFFGGNPATPAPIAPTPRPAAGYAAGVKQAAVAGIDKAKQGVADISTAKNPIQLIEGAAKEGAGVIEAASSPLTAALAPVFSPVGKFLGYVSDKLSDHPAVQKFAASPAGEITSRVAEDVGNLNTIAGVAAGPKAPVDAAGAATARVSGATTDLARSSVDAVGRGIESTGQKIQQSVIRPSTRDISDGFKIENVSKYNLGGTLPETITKSHATMNDLTHQLSQKLAGAQADISLAQTFANTAARLKANKSRAFGDNGAIDRVLKNLQAEIKQVAGKDGKVDLVEATNIKRGAGSKGAWAFNRPEADASAIEKVYTEFYNVLKGDIEKNAPAGVKEINKQLSEIIPIQNAALRRLPVEQRNNLFSLTDSMGLMSALIDPKALLLLGATRAARSGRVGNALTKAGQAIRTKSQPKQDI